ncbi:MAG: lysophospholipid acyltransferase family protein [Granulosicoccus sp.]
MQGSSPTFKWKRFLRFRLMPSWLAMGFFWLLAKLPFSAVMTTGRILGSASFYLMSSRRRIAQINLSLAFPEKSETDIRLLTRQAFRNMGMAGAETAWIWHRWPDMPAEITIKGGEHIDAALANGRGVILLQAHFTVLELCGAVVGKRWSVAAVYDEPKNPLFADYIFSQRSRHLDKLIDNNGIREMVRCLKRGGIVWYSPDQSVSTARGGVKMKFFGQDALTTTGTARIVALTGATVIPFVPLRHDNGKRYTFTFKQPIAFESDDTLAMTQQVNDQMEADVRLWPEQYLWSHKRFKPPGHDYPNPYA